MYMHVRVMRIAYVVPAEEFFLPFSVRASLRLLFVFLFSWTFHLARISGFSSLLNFKPNESCRLAMGSKHSGLKWSLQSFELGVGPLHLARVSFTFVVQIFRYFSSLGKLCILVSSLEVLPQPAATHLVGILRNIPKTSASWSY